MEHRFFEIIPSNTSIDFVRAAKPSFFFSAAIALTALVLVFTRGLNYSVDFEGGTEVHVKFAGAVESGEVRRALQPVGMSEAIVQELGERGSGEFIIRVEAELLDIEGKRDAFVKALNPLFPDSGVPVRLRFASDRMFATFPRPVDPEAIASAIGAMKLEGLNLDNVSPFGRETDNEYRVQFSGAGGRVMKALEDRFGKHSFDVLQVEFVGPKVGKELRLQALGALLISILLILVYIWFRFEFEFAPGAVLALTHDALVVLGMFSLFRLKFDLTSVAAILTIVGYSINDTIVVYDRIRENIRKSKTPRLPDVINRSVNETLSRTILTGGTTLIATIALLVWGGPITFNFALALTVGTVVGTYSSVCVASPVTIWVQAYLAKRQRAASSA